MYVQCEKYNDLQLQQLYVYVSDFLSCPQSYLQHQYNTVVFCQPPLITLASDLGGENMSQVPCLRPTAGSWHATWGICLQLEMKVHKSFLNYGEGDH